MKQRLFTYAVLFHPTEEEEKTGKKTEIIVPITSAVANDEKSLAIVAARSIPEALVDKLDQVEILVRSF